MRKMEQQEPEKVPKELLEKVFAELTAELTVKLIAEEEKEKCLVPILLFM